MGLPMFTPGTDPGPNFVGLLKSAGIRIHSEATGQIEVPHGTTCVALRHAGGVVIAGDRRATSGSYISSGSMEKVVQADDYCGVAISGAAGPAVSMIHLFQLQLEHYEKMEGHPLTLEGKANQLSAMVRDNLPAAMQGLVVHPLFAGIEPRDGSGHIWSFDVTGGRYEEQEFAAIGSGMMHAAMVIKVGWNRNLSRNAAVALACRSLWEAAQSDSATGGPDMLRGVYPIVASVTADGWETVTDAELQTIFSSLEEEVRAR
mgnify:CR=1 FL=1